MLTLRPWRPSRAKKSASCEICINQVKRNIRKSKHIPKIIFPEGGAHKVLKAANLAVEEGVVEPILLGNAKHIRRTIEDLDLEKLQEVRIIEPRLSDKYEEYSKELYRMKHRRGIMEKEAHRLMNDTNYYGAMAVHRGDADGVVSGATIKYKEAVKPILNVIGSGKRKTASGMNIVLCNDRVFFLFRHSR